MSKLFVIIGLPGSGKSFEARKIAEEETAIIVSSDAIRKEINGDENDQNNGGKVFEIAKKRLKEALTEGRNVIMDSTNISCKRRIALLEEMKKYATESIAVLMATPFEMCVERQNLRERKVDVEVITRMYHNFQVPYYYEGWNKIEVVYPGRHWTDRCSKNIIDLITGCGELFDFDQKNPHHQMTLGWHMNACYEYVRHRSDDVSLCEAALFHDIGKIKTQTFDTNGVAHYYQHHCVSGYDSLFEFGFCFNDDERLLRAAYIQWHMGPYFWKEEKTQKKYKNLLGDEFYNNLMLLHEGDVQAH